MFSDAGTWEREADVCPKASSSRPLWQPVGQELSQMEGGATCGNRPDVVWTHIGFVRKKMKSLGADVEIKTIRGAGYSLEVGTC